MRRRSVEPVLAPIKVGRMKDEVELGNNVEVFERKSGENISPAGLHALKAFFGQI